MSALEEICVVHAEKHLLSLTSLSKKMLKNKSINQQIHFKLASFTAILVHHGGHSPACGVTSQ